jgi:hypothetical protein
MHLFFVILKQAASHQQYDLKLCRQFLGICSKNLDIIIRIVDEPKKFGRPFVNFFEFAKLDGKVMEGSNSKTRKS